MWSDTLDLLHGILGDLPSGPFGAIVRICVAAVVLLALLAVVDMVTLKNSALVLQLVVLMFLFFIVSVLVYVIRPPDDLALARSQANRARQIAPKRIQQSEKASA